MKSYLKILFLMLIFIVSLTIVVHAADEYVAIDGDSTATAGETKEVILRTKANIGMVAGTIKVTGKANIVKVEAQNGWNLLVNEASAGKSGKIIISTGDFNNPKPEEILKITYTAQGSEGTATITFEEPTIVLVNGEDDEEQIEIEGITKNITVKAASQGGNNNQGGNENPGNTPSGSGNNDNTPSGDNGNKPATDNNNKPAADNGNKPATTTDNASKSATDNGSKAAEDNSKANKAINYTGAKDYVIITVVALAVGIISFIKYRQYRFI